MSTTQDRMSTENDTLTNLTSEEPRDVNWLERQLQKIARHPRKSGEEKKEEQLNLIRQFKKDNPHLFNLLLIVATIATITAGTGFYLTGAEQTNFAELLPENNGPA